MISNALKFTPCEGSAKLVASVVTSLGEPVTDTNRENDILFHIEVHDTSPGISSVRESRINTRALYLAMHVHIQSAEYLVNMQEN
jgi:signal transduction histidine kinase